LYLAKEAQRCGGASACSSKLLNSSLLGGGRFGKGLLVRTPERTGEGLIKNGGIGKRETNRDGRAAEKKKKNKKGMIRPWCPVKNGKVESFSMPST